MKVRNLACFDDKDHELSLAPLTVLVGPNNAGKSTMFSGFNMLRTSLFRNVAWAGETYNLGDFATAVYNHDMNRSISLGTSVGPGDSYASLSTVIEPRGFRGFSWNPPNVDLPTAQGFLRNCWYFRPSRSGIDANRRTDQSAEGTPWGQQLDPSASNLITFLLERWTDQDPDWDIAQEWVKRFDPQSSLLKTPLRSNNASLVTRRDPDVDVNLAYQGTGVQRALAAIAAVIFSPPNSSIIIEEPEVHLHKNSQAILADLFNFAVMKMKKQIIFTTHSWDLLLPYISDVCRDMRKRGGEAVVIDPAKFRLQEFKRVSGQVTIEEYSLEKNGFKDAQSHFGQLLG